MQPGLEIGIGTARDRKLSVVDELAATVTPESEIASLVISPHTDSENARTKEHHPGHSDQIGEGICAKQGSHASLCVPRSFKVPFNDLAKGTGNQILFQVTFR